MAYNGYIIGLILALIYMAKNLKNTYILYGYFGLKKLHWKP